MKKLLLTVSLIGLTSVLNAQWTSQATGFSDASRGLGEIKIVNEGDTKGLYVKGQKEWFNVEVPLPNEEIVFE